MKNINESYKRKFDKCYLIVYAVNSTISIKNDNEIYNTTLYTFIGINCRGKRRYLGSYIDDIDNHRYWLNIFEQFKNNGIDDIVFLAVNDCIYLKKCAKISFPDINFVPLLLDIVDNFYKYFSDKFSTKIRSEIKQLYICTDINEFKNKFDLFLSKYGENKILMYLVNKYLNNIEVYYKYNQGMRIALFNNYALKILKNSIEKNNQKIGYINNIDDIIQLVNENIENIEKFSSYTKKEWLNILLSFYDMVPERIERYL